MQLYLPSLPQHGESVCPAMRRHRLQALAHQRRGVTLSLCAACTCCAASGGTAWAPDRGCQRFCLPGAFSCGQMLALEVGMRPVTGAAAAAFPPSA